MDDGSGDLPNVAQWLPREDAKASLRTGLMLTCQAAQSRIIAEAKIERQFNIDNYDSGAGVEDIVRQEIAKLLPHRYSVEPGVINDAAGRTAGDCDVVIRDHAWSPTVKLGATPQSRRLHFPIEGVYSVFEVKQTIGADELDAAMEKLVRVSRLDRPENPYGHITENQHLPGLDRDGYILNPLHTTVLGVGAKAGTTFEELATRFGRINSLLEREHRVTALCVLDPSGTAWYSTRGAANATHMWDRQEALKLRVIERDDSFYRLFVHLFGHLTRSVLNITNVSTRYGEPNLGGEDLEFPDSFGDFLGRTATDNE
ncbi:MAG: hypothetical protein OXH97_02355 [Chloroflexota bacterium]|nr:hypothetical protein [Chloroflexota bacterium]